MEKLSEQEKESTNKVKGNIRSLEHREAEFYLTSIFGTVVLVLGVSGVIHSLEYLYSKTSKKK